MEAAFSLQLDYDQIHDVTVSGYASLWRWSRKRVSNFFNNMGAAIKYPENTKKKQNQRGQISIQTRNRSGTDKEQIRLVDSKGLESPGNRNGTDREQIRSRSGSTTKDPDPNPNIKTYSSDSIEYRLSALLFSLIQTNNPNAKTPNFNQWSKQIDLMIRIDKRMPEEIESVIRWCQADFFWAGNILSTNKLRKQFDQLWLKGGKAFKTEAQLPAGMK